MSNRLLGLLIVLGFILAGIAFYLYAFVTYTGSLIIQSSVPEYTVQLTGKTASEKNNYEIFCEEGKCSIPKLSPFEYSIFITKEGYKPFSTKTEIPRKNTVVLEVNLEKDTLLSEVPAEKTPESTEAIAQQESATGTGLIEQKSVLSPRERIERIRKKKSYYAHYEIEKFGEVFFKKQENQVILGVIDLDGKEKILERFKGFIEAENIQVFEVIGNNNSVVIIYGEKKYLYNRETVSFEELDFGVDIEYVKYYHKRDLAFVTEKGMFIYSKENGGTFEYMSNFYDSVYLNNNYIGVIQESDALRKKSFGFEKEAGDIIVFQKQTTKEKKIIYRPTFSVSKIYLQEEKIIVESGKGEQFVLENY